MTHSDVQSVPIAPTAWATTTTYWTDQQRDLVDMSETMHRAANATVGHEFRLDPTARVQRAVDDIRHSLARAIAYDGCQAASGCCPNHGEADLIVGADGWTTCDGGCGRVWTYDRTARPCGYPAVVDGRCAGHQPVEVSA